MQVDWYAHHFFPRLIRPGVNAGQRGIWHSEYVGSLYTKSSHRFAIFTYQQSRLFDVRNSSCILRDDKTFQKRKGRILTVGWLEMEIPASHLAPFVTDLVCCLERNQFSTVWGRLTEETPLISSEGSLIFSILEDTWSVWSSHQVFLFSIRHRCMYTSPAARRL